MKHTVLVVDDEEAITEILEMNLAMAGYQVMVAFNGEQAIDKAKRLEPDLILLDVGLPDMEGFEVCKKLRGFTDAPIIMVTARGENHDKIQGLEQGADDYVLKPFDPAEIVARVKANLRRVSSSGGGSSSILSFHDFEVDRIGHKIVVRGEELRLSPKEYALLSFLIENAEEVLSRDKILEEVWGSLEHDSRNVDIHIRFLREKLGEELSAKYLHTVWGKGYRFGAPSF